MFRPDQNWWPTLGINHIPRPFFCHGKAPFFLLGGQRSDLLPNMSTPSIQVLGVFAVAASDGVKNVEDKSNRSSRLMLQGRITISSHDDSFDTVEILLQGAVRSQIGSQVAVEKLPPSTEVRARQDFQPVSTVTTQRRSEERYLDFVCPVPSAASTKEGRGSSPTVSPGGFVPSMSISGTTFVTRVTALRDRHVVQGRCDVAYSLEAEFLRSGSSQPVRRQSCPVEISSLLAPLAVEVQSPSLADRVEQAAKPQLRSFSRFRSSQAHPDLLVSLPKRLGRIPWVSSRSATASRRLPIPVSIRVMFPTQPRRPGQKQGQDQDQAPSTADFLKCSIQAQWHTKRTFTTGSSAVESVVHSDCISTQRLALTSPPLYRCSAPENSTYTTSMDLELLVPESISSPCICTDLLDISYTLDLAMKFEFGADDEAVRGPYAAEFKLPLMLRTAQPQTTNVRQREFDPVLGLVEEEVLHGPPPYVC